LVVSTGDDRADTSGMPPFLPEVVIGALVLGGMVADQLRRSTGGSARPAVVPVEARRRRRTPPHR
jgi:hypothetical protein